MHQISLIEVPKRPMKKIIDSYDFPAILNLRKTCHYFRNLLPTLNSRKYQITELGFSEGISEGFPKTPEISLFMCLKNGRESMDSTYPSGSWIKLSYYQNEDGCEIFWKRSDNNRIKFLKNQNYLDHFVRDFAVFMENQHVEKLEIWRLYGLSKKFHEVLDPTKIKFSVKKVIFSGTQEPGIIGIIPFFKPKVLESIHIGCCQDDKKVYMTLKEVTKTEQWKKAKSFHLGGEGFMVPIEDFTNFDDFDERGFALEFGTIDDLRVMKEAFLTSTSITKTFQLLSRHWPNRQTLYEFLDPTQEREIDSNYFTYCRPHNPNQVLEIQIKAEEFNFKSFNFRIIDYRDVGRNEMVHVSHIVPMEIDAKKILRDLLWELRQNGRPREKEARSSQEKRKETLMR